jgi:hypothetical protein
MAENFKISVHRNSDNLHLKLLGDFDDASALELLDTVKKLARGASKVFIHTSTLDKVHPVEMKNVLKTIDDMGDRGIPFYFTGNYEGVINRKI